MTDCKSLGEVHERIRIAFDFPEWYGANWHAFLDLLRTDCNADKVVVVGENTLPKAFRPEMAAMHKVFEKMKNHCKEHNDKFDYEIVGEL